MKREDLATIAPPSFFGGLRISSSLALTGAVVAEFVAGAGVPQFGLMVTLSCWHESEME